MKKVRSTDSSHSGNPARNGAANRLFPAASATAAAVLLLSIAGANPARGASVTLIADMASGEDWSIGARWSDGQPANSANDYFVGSGAGKVSRSTNNATTATFPGNSLQLDATGIMRLKGANNDTVTFPALRMNGGTLHNGNGNNTTTVAGAMSVQAASNLDISQMTGNAFNAGSDTTRTLILSGSITGSGPLNIGNGNTAALATSTVFATYGRVETTNPLNLFSGGWNVNSGLLHGTALGSLGTGNIAIAPAGGFDTDYDVTLPSAALSLNGVMQLDQNDTFGSIAINGTALSAGTYSASQLASQFPNNFVPGGTGSLTVAGVPEPSGWALGFAVVSGLLLARPGGLRRRPA